MLDKITTDVFGPDKPNLKIEAEWDVWSRPYFEPFKPGEPMRSYHITQPLRYASLDYDYPTGTPILAMLLRLEAEKFGEVSYGPDDGSPDPIDTEMMAQIALLATHHFYRLVDEGRQLRATLGEKYPWE